ncbi:polysaccharide deacetylase family protein [Fulvivirga lutea]|uniref:Polysaccharide deacetylase family protein n=1 Tax=Fulvivirga lutea TaxID=2810512 RepID=A0A974WJ93_9BACT|nr:polysaccharide deacetylase family protein [Fulvivirga lutea]QSE97175.1 polysaccharide deacetylase family protein [Fulvivirga lutea]
MFFHRTPRFVQQLYPSLIWRKKTKDKILFLTFDDGPIPSLTEFILNTLQENHIQATFFCVGGNLKKNRTIAVRAIEEGHQLGNHTFNHLNGWKNSASDYLNNIVECERELHSLDQNKGLFRPPYGKLKRSQIKLIKKNHKIIMWDVLSGDYSKSISPKDCLYNTIKATNRGSIVLFHDNVKAEKNIRYALPRYIEHYQKKGYSFGLV